VLGHCQADARELNMNSVFLSNAKLDGLSNGGDPSTRMSMVPCEAVVPFVTRLVE
jgi:hypothetical protein